MAIDPNNPLNFQPSDIKTLQDFTTNPAEEIVDKLLQNGRQIALTNNGRFIAMIEPIPQDEQTQTALATRFLSLDTSSNAKSMPDKTSEASIISYEREELISKITDEARRLAEMNELDEA